MLKENRKKEILEKANQIYEGKKRKFLETLEKKKKAKKSLCETSMVEDQASKNLEEAEQGQDDQVPTNSEEINVNLHSEGGTEKISNESDPPESEEFVMDKDAIIEAELNKVSEVSKELCVVQLFTGMLLISSNFNNHLKKKFNILIQIGYFLLFMLLKMKQ